MMLSFFTGDGCDHEALRVVNLFPTWTSRKQQGYPIIVKVTLPIEFILQDERK